MAQRSGHNVNICFRELRFTFKNDVSRCTCISVRKNKALVVFAAIFTTVFDAMPENAELEDEIE